MLVGIPQKEYLMLKDDEEKWVTEKTINQYVSMGYELCPYCDPRMSYAAPSWVPTDEDQEVIVCLDDFLRGSALFQQAIMSLIQFGEYISWKLPKKAHLILTSNPNNGEYSNATELDSAQASRMLTLNVEFDVKPWARWAESQSMPSSLINFALLNSEIFERGHIINARSYTLFANALESVEDLSTPESMSLASLIAEGSFGEDGSYISGMFIQFINNKLDKLITPEQMINGKWEEVKKQLITNIYKDGQYRCDIASVLTMRFINYAEVLIADMTKDTSKKLVDRIYELVTFKDDKHSNLLSEDLIFKLIATLNSNKKFESKMIKLLSIPEVRAKVV